ncbi:MAG: FprA family A-type flavoprotein [Candidatus Saganbacteria bacterium]|nr:FprA family A-type flavoprotein [Candidatus Saganbacteria bacterium]
MEPVKIAENVYWVGAIDWEVREFHGSTYHIPRGTTYNAYLILDEKPTLIDTVRDSFAGEMLERIGKIIDPKDIHYIISNHTEPDHSGSLPAMLNINPKAKVICSGKGKEGLSKYYSDKWDFQVVKTGDTLNLGKRNLKFIEAPMLHWPDSMFTYAVEDQILFPNDAFGEHLASSQRFADEIDPAILEEELKKYYANILYPLSRLIPKKIEELAPLGVTPKIIAPSHGAIWRKDLDKLIQFYLKWSGGWAEEKVVVLYETIWDSTKKMAKAIAEGVASAGVPVFVSKISETPLSDLIKEIVFSKGFILGSSTVNNDLLAGVVPLLEELKGLKPRARVGAAFGSYGWAGGATKAIEEQLTLSGMQIVMPAQTVRFAPSESELAACFEFGKQFAGKVKGSS